MVNKPLNSSGCLLVEQKHRVIRKTKSVPQALLGKRAAGLIASLDWCSGRKERGWLREADGWGEEEPGRIQSAEWRENSPACITHNIKPCGSLFVFVLALCTHSPTLLIMGCPWKCLVWACWLLSVHFERKSIREISPWPAALPSIGISASTRGFVAHPSIPMLWATEIASGRRMFKLGC